MIHDLLGRDLSRDLDNYITGHYGEDQFKKGGRKVSKHYSDRHPAVAAVACPVCQRGPGLPCVVARTGRRREQHGNETHVGRVNVYEHQQQDKARFEELARQANAPA